MKPPGAKYSDGYLADRRALESALSAAQRQTGQAGHFRVSFIDATSSIDEVWAFDNSVYPGGNISRETLVAWRMRFPFGGYALRDRSDILVGVIGIWPITAATANSIRSERLKEDELRPIDDVGIGLSASDWYLSGIAVAPALRGTQATPFFLASAMLLWSAIARSEQVPRFTAVAFSSAGERLLNRAKFHSVGQNADGERVYMLERERWAKLAGIVSGVMLGRPRPLPPLTDADGTQLA